MFVCAEEMEIGITGGVEDGVDNSGAAKEHMSSHELIITGDGCGFPLLPGETLFHPCRCLRCLPGPFPNFSHVRAPAGHACII